jgi:hypothetical protein
MRSKSRLYPENAGVGLDHMSAADKLALAMIPEIEIWRAASLMLKRYGEKALEQHRAADRVRRDAAECRQAVPMPSHERTIVDTS